MVALAVSAYAARRRGRRLSGPANQHEGRTVRRLMQLDRDAVARLGVMMDSRPGAPIPSRSRRALAPRTGTDLLGKGSPGSDLGPDDLAASLVAIGRNSAALHAKLAQWTSFRSRSTSMTFLVQGPSMSVCSTQHQSASSMCSSSRSRTLAPSIRRDERLDLPQSRRPACDHRLPACG